MTVRMICGHVIDALKEMPPGSVHCVVCSPPYFGLRDYQLAPQIWDSPAGGCKHRWGDEQMIALDAHRNLDFNARWDRPVGQRKQETSRPGAVSQGQWCQVSGCWRGSLGLERDVASYVRHLVQVFEEVKRVLRDDGVMFVNMGDAYNSGTQFNHGSPSSKQAYGEWDGNWPGHRPKVQGLKSKDLIGLPWLVAFALQAHGWYLRSAIPWIKGNAMPESVRDRPSASVEYVFLFSKQASYFYDIDGIRIPHTMKPQRRPQGRPRDETPRPNGQPKQSWPTAQRSDLGTDGHPAGRNRRNGDWWVESLDRVIGETEAWLAHAREVRASGGLLLSPNGELLGFKVNPHPYAEAHFASFAPALVEPMLQAGSSERGCCPQCLAPWTRVVEVQKQRNAFGQGGGPKAEKSEAYRLAGGIGRMDGGRRAVDGSTFHNNPAKRPLPPSTLGWRPTCTHYPRTHEWRAVPRQQRDEPDAVYAARIAPIMQARHNLMAFWAPLPVEPCTVLDPFGGAMTTGLVANRLGRHAILIELNPAYVQMGLNRIRDDAPLLAEVSVESLATFPEESTENPSPVMKGVP